MLRFGWLVVVICLVPTVAMAQVRSNGYITVTLGDGVISSLSFDATGKGNYGLETVASRGISGCKDVSLNGNVLTIEPEPGKSITWDMPFVKAGYYDADAHLNYPSEKTTAGAAPLTLPFVSFTSANGNYLRIEHFKRLAMDPLQPTGSPGRLLIRSDASQNWDIELTFACPTLKYWPQDNALTLGPFGEGPVKIEVLPRAKRDMPGDSVQMPKVRFTPDPKIIYAPTGKTVGLSELATDFIRMGTFFYPDNQVVGEWAVAADLHLNDDPRGAYIPDLRHKLLKDQNLIGYDRFGHFGYAYAWGRYPDYGAGGLLNLPPDQKAPWDMRMLHVNGIRIRAFAKYVLATGDTIILKARRTRVLRLGDAKPISDVGWDSDDFVLSSGDVRLDGKPATVHHSLGQEFTAAEPFTKVSALLGNPSGGEPNHGKIALYDRKGGSLIAQDGFSLKPSTSEYVGLTVPECAPGKYYVEVTDDDSGVRYFGPGVVWKTRVESSYTGGDSYNGPHHGDTLSELNVLFDYMRNYMGAAATNMAYYQNDREFNGPVHRSGRNKVCTENSYWETAGGARDAYVAIWYNEACSAMADIYEVLGDAKKAAEFRKLRHLADEAYRKLFWRTVTENGREFSRFYGCRDWDGVIHDQGFAHFNLEAAAAGIATPQQARDILWWLDRGQYSTDGGKTWTDGIYSIWQAAPVFNTIETSSWVNVTGTLPWRQVLVNGGARMDTSARDLLVRSKYLSAENMHERNTRIMERFASPDRLTGGRTFPDPGGRGRWHFLEPDSNLADFEGFREIFPQGGVVASYQPRDYLGIDYTPKGLKLRPRVPSEINLVEFSNFGYWGALFNLKAEATRKIVLDQRATHTREIRPGDDVDCEFSASAKFNKAGVRIAISPFKSKLDNQLTITLYRLIGSKRIKIAENWYNHVTDGQWVWVDANRYLPAGEYSVVTSSVRPSNGEAMSVYSRAGKPAVRLVDEKTTLIVTAARPDIRTFALALTGSNHGNTESGKHGIENGRSPCRDGNTPLVLSSEERAYRRTVVLEPSQSAMLLHP